MGDPGARGLFEHVESLVIRCDARGTILDVLHAARQERSAQRLEGRNLEEMLDPDSRVKMRNFLDTAASEGVAAPWEMTAEAGTLRVLSFAGVVDTRGIIVAAAANSAALAALLETAAASKNLADASASRLREAGQMVRRHAAAETSFLDVLTRQHNEMAVMQRELAKANAGLESQREWLGGILTGLQEAVIVVDADCRVTFANPSAAQLVGREGTWCIGRPAGEVVALSCAGRTIDTAAWLGEVITSGRPDGIAQCAMESASGQRVEVSGTATPVRDARGEPSGVVMVFRDLTEALRIQALVVDAKRLEVSKEIAAAVAHTVNNLLAVISANAQILARDLPRENRVIQAIKDSVVRAVDLTSRLLSSTGQVVPVEERVTLDSLLRETVLLAGPFSAEVEVEMMFAEPSCAVRGDPSLLSVAFRDILVNARESIRGNGKITITTRRVRETGGTEPHGLQAQVAIRDDGCGMTAEVQSRLFEPFFSTKFLGRGLGLPSARGIITRHGGRVEVESREGGGTTVTVTLPMDEQADPV